SEDELFVRRSRRNPHPRRLGTRHFDRFHSDASSRRPMKKKLPLLALATALAPGLALAATPKTFADLANQIVQLLSSATTDLIVFAIVVYFWGVSSSLFKGGEEARGALRQQLLWGVFVLFLAVSIFGVVQLLQSS